MPTESFGRRKGLSRISYLSALSRLCHLRFFCPLGVAKQTWLLRAVYDCLGALLVSAFAIPAAEGAGTVEFSTARTIDDLAVGAVSVIAADIDGDGDNDIVAAMYGGHDILWYQNLDGKGTFAEGDEISDLFNPT